MAEAKKQAARGGKGAQRTAGQAAGKGGNKGRAGRLTVKRDTAPYRAAAEEQASRVRKVIEASLVVARRTREEIEQRIENQLHARTGAGTAKKAKAKGAPKRRKARAAH